MYSLLVLSGAYAVFFSEAVPAPKKYIFRIRNTASLNPSKFKKKREKDD